MENHRGSPPLQSPPSARADGGRVPPSAGVLLASAPKPSALPGRPAQLTLDQAASHPHPPGPGPAVGAAAGGGASRWAGPRAPLPHCSAGPAPAAAQSIKRLPRGRSAVG